jgi:dTDP-glucose 4,6-dehydratase
MRILVTGGYGFIGSNFINNIIDKPEVELVVNVDSQTYAADLNNIQLSEHPKYASSIFYFYCDRF